MQPNQSDSKFIHSYLQSLDLTQGQKYGEPSENWTDYGLLI